MPGFLCYMVGIVKKTIFKISKNGFCNMHMLPTRPCLPVTDIMERLGGEIGKRQVNFTKKFACPDTVLLAQWIQVMVYKTFSKNVEGCRDGYAKDYRN